MERVITECIRGDPLRAVSSSSTTVFAPFNARFIKGTACGCFFGYGVASFPSFFGEGGGTNVSAFEAWD